MLPDIMGACRSAVKMLVGASQVLDLDGLSRGMPFRRTLYV